MDNIWAKNAANSFWMAAARSMEQRRLDANQFQMLLIPGVVCSAFAIELGIKSILLPSGRPKYTGCWIPACAGMTAMVIPRKLSGGFTFEVQHLMKKKDKRRPHWGPFVTYPSGEPILPS